MDSLKIYSQSDIIALINLRDGEIKLGERVQTYRHRESLSEDIEEGNNEAISLISLKVSTATFVLLGIPEDIGVRANLGIAGAKTAWAYALKALLNIQSNPFLKGEEILVLGHFEIAEPKDTSLEGLRKKTSEVDELVQPIIEKIVSAGKIPIVIGGGHNNAAPIISGVSTALKQSLNVLNIDAHADLRETTEGRHSGNGFSYAMEHGFLNQYKIFGLQQNYVNQNLPSKIAANPNVEAFYFEDLLQSTKSINENWDDFTKNLNEQCGLEIDLDSVENVLSSAVTPSGFDVNDIRKLLIGNGIKFCYLHICEGAIELSDGRKDVTTGKTIAYLIGDFIKALRPHIYQQP